jgi:hypothetical protein
MTAFSIVGSSTSILEIEKLIKVQNLLCHLPKITHLASIYLIQIPLNL